MVLQSAAHEEFSRPIRGLERFADNSNTPWNQPTIFHPDRTAAISRMFLLSLCVLPVLHKIWLRTTRRQTYNGSTIDLHKLCQIPVSYLCKSPSDWLSVREKETFEGSFPLPEKSLFCTDKHATIEWPNLARSPRTCDCCATHNPHWELLWSAVIKSPRVSARSMWLPVRFLQTPLVFFDPSAYFASSVLRAICEHSVLPWFHFW